MTSERDSSTPIASSATTSVEPIGEVGSLPAVCKCGVTERNAKGDRCANGHNLKGQAGPALVTGEHGVTFWSAQEAVIQEIIARIVADAGHTPEDAPTALTMAAEGVAQAITVRDSAFRRLVESGGPLTSSGRTRRAFSVWTAALDRAERHLRLVGLESKPKRVQTLSDIMREHADAVAAE